MNLVKDLAREIEKTIKEWQRKGGIEPAKKLFATCLDFKLVSSPIDIRNQPWKDEINGIPEVLAEKGSFRVLYFPLNGSLRITIERKIINLMRRDHPSKQFWIKVRNIRLGNC